MTEVHTATEQSTSARPPEIAAESEDMPSSMSDVPAANDARLRDQITRSLKPGKRGKAGVPAKTKNKRVDDALTAWGGLSHNSDAVEAMIAAQLVVTHELTMATIADAFACRDNSRIQLSRYLDNVCKMTRASLQQVETLARYRTWRRRTEAGHQQQETGS